MENKELCANYADFDVVAQEEYDSIYYQMMIDDGASEHCAMVAAYEMTDIVLKRYLPNRCHSQDFHFRFTEAEMNGELLTLTFATKNRIRSAFSNKLIKVFIMDGTFEAKVIHASSEEIEIEQYDGSISKRRAPTSTTKKVKIDLTSDDHAPGKQICGSINISSVFQRGKKSNHVREEISGTFRAIVNNNENCLKNVYPKSLVER